MNKLNYYEGLSKNYIFVIFICKIFLWKRFKNFKKGVEMGMHPMFSFNKHILKEK